LLDRVDHRERIDRQGDLERDGVAEGAAFLGHERLVFDVVANGQHDVQLLPGGNATEYEIALHDNSTNLPGPPRGLRYEIDETARTATLKEEVTDPLAPSSFCCGSARRSVDGSWLFSWGGRSLVTEFDASGQRTFRLGFGGTVFSYRATSVPDGALSVADLRAGMDSMHPRP